VETLVELDHDYAVLAKTAGCETYIRAPALGVNASFIRGLTKIVEGALAAPAGVSAASDYRCAFNLSKCACAKAVTGESAL